MKKLFLIGLIATITAAGCRKIVEDANPNTGGGNNGGGQTGQTIVLQGKIDKDTTLRAVNSYELKGLVYITNNATITIEAGTTIKGQYTDPVGGLVITRGARIMAKGTADKPIVFTSASSTPHAGDWAGIVLLGRAKTNASFNGQAGVGEIEGGVNDAAGNGLYGGADDNDNSGVLQYVRIEYAGYAFLPDKEINSLTMGGVGRGTTIDHVQVSYAKDDAYEWFGGTVDARYLIAYRTQDDDFDTDNGYSGRVQFGLVIRDSSVADVSKSEAMESDNDANGSANTPQTSAVFSNLTLIGPKATGANKGNNYFLAAVQVRRNTAISLFNSVILGWPIGIDIDASKGRAVDNNIADSSLRIRNTIIAGCDIPVKYTGSSTESTGWTTTAAQGWFANAYFANTVFNTNDEARFINPFNYSSPDYAPFGNSAAATGAAFNDPKLAEGFTAVTFRGAIAPAGADATWYKGWTRFN